MEVRFVLQSTHDLTAGLDPVCSQVAGTARLDASQVSTATWNNNKAYRDGSKCRAALPRETVICSRSSRKLVAKQELNIDLPQPRLFFNYCASLPP